MVFKSFLGKIKQGLARTRRVFGDVAALFRLRGRVDQAFLDELERRLYLADVGNDRHGRYRRPGPAVVSRQGNHRRRGSIRQTEAP